MYEPCGCMGILLYKLSSLVYKDMKQITLHTKNRVLLVTAILNGQ